MTQIEEALKEKVRTIENKIEERKIAEKQREAKVMEILSTKFKEMLDEIVDVYEKSE